MENLNDTAQQHSHYTMHHKMFPLFPAQVTVNFVYSCFLSLVEYVERCSVFIAV